MTITSSGYDGTIGEGTWSTLAPLLGQRHAVASDADWKVTIGGTGTGAVTVAAGTAFGSGVMDVNSASINLNATTVSSGSRWDTVVIRRDWSGTGGTTTTAIVVGTSSKAITLTNTTPGTIEDQPIALIRSQSGQTAVQELIDLRTTSGKIHTVPTAAAVALMPVRLGSWVYSLDTRTLWHGENVSGTPTWANTTDVPWVALSLAGAWAAGSTAPAHRVVNGQLQFSGSATVASGIGLTAGAHTVFYVIAAAVPSHFTRIPVAGSGFESELEIYGADSASPGRVDFHNYTAGALQVQLAGAVMAVR